MAILELEDFSGGITDYYLNAPQNKLKTCDNLLLDFYPTMGKPSTRPGSKLYSSTAPQVPTAQRINTCFYYKDILYVQSGQKLFYFKDGAWVEVYAPLSASAFIGATTSVYFNYSHWNYHTLISGSDYMYPKKVIHGEDGVPYVVEAGLPKYPSDGAIFGNVAGDTTTATYNFIYKLVYRYEYKTFGGVSFVDVGTPATFEVVGRDSVKITGLKPLPTGQHFDRSKCFIDIYRTENNGTIFYKIGSVSSNATEISISSDYETNEANPISAKETIYTTGGVIENDRPPKCLTVHVKGDVAYYGNIIESTGDKISYRVVQSVPADIDSVPESFYVDLDDDIICVSSTKSNVVVLCKKTIYRLDGQFDELGRGGISFERISDTAGCISPQGAVQALDGVFWLGQEGVYFTDGFKVIRINTDYDKSYRSFVASNNGVTDDKSFRLQGKYDRKKNRVWWAMSKDNGLDLDFCYVLDLNWGISEKSTFTTVSGDSFAPSAIEFVDGNLIRCDRRGYIFQHQDNYFSDIKIDTSLLPSAWREETIRYNFETAAFNFGTSGTRKYVTQANVTCTGTTNVSLQIISNNDDGKVVSELNPIRFRGNVNWGDDIYWGDTTLFWNRKGMVHEKRRMPAKSLRCNFKSIQLTNAKVAIINSTSIGNIVINPELKIVTLLNSSSFDWPLRSVGYFIAFEQDGYQEEFEILERSSDTLRYLDPNGVILPSSNSGWVIRGYPQGEVLNLLNMSLVYEFSGPTLSTFRTAGTGEVG